jgi:hypothetical protein
MNPRRPTRRLRWLLLAAAVAGAAALTSTAAAPPAGAALPTVQVWLTTADGSTNLAQQPSIGLSSVTRGAIDVAVDDSRSYQTISGFGAAFTDSSASLMAQLKSSNPSTYTTMMNDLFERNRARLLADPDDRVRLPRAEHERIGVDVEVGAPALRIGGLEALHSAQSQRGMSRPPPSSQVARHDQHRAGSGAGENSRREMLRESRESYPPVAGPRVVPAAPRPFSSVARIF